VDALITGASRGIGRAIAIRLARDGARVVVNYLQNGDEAQKTCALVAQAGGEARAIQADVRSPEALKGLVNETRDWLGGLDALIHNAAIGALKPMDTLRVNQWDLTLQSSLRPFWLLSKLCLPLFRDNSAIIGLSSLGSRQYTPGYAAMGAAKGGMEALTRQLAVELAPKIRVNTVCGGLIDTDAVQHIPDHERLRVEIANATPLQRLGQPDDLAGVVALLLSQDARWINGQVLVADGGFSCV
jgi:enoyl-[acyl-carrier protein] reductase III